MSSRTVSPIVNKTIDLNFMNKKKNSSFKWSIINGSLFAIFAYDLSCKCPQYTTYFHLTEYVLSAVLGLNALYHTIRYLYISLTMTPVTITPIQKRLLGFKDNDTSFKLSSSSPGRASTPEMDQTEPFSISSRSWLSNSSPNASRQSVTSSSWNYQQGSPTSQMQNVTASFNISADEDFISDQRTLADFLRAFEEREALERSGRGVEGETGTVWNPCPDVVRARPQYQLAQLTSQSTAEEGSPGTPSSTQGWWTLHLDPQRLTQWNLNLRLWIHKTIIERLIGEMKNIDEALHKHVLGEVSVGQVSLERLSKTARSSYIAQHVPTLQPLLPFLQLTNNQEYLVQRIKELGNGGCLSEFKWNGGGRFNDKPWEESLPTDSELVMHLFATYMDSQLLPVTQNPDGHPFSSQHLSKHPEKPRRGPKALVIHQASSRPPHYVLIHAGETVELAKGRNNLIHTILLFLHTVATERHGMLGRVNLGRSGVNILWVIGR